MARWTWEENQVCLQELPAYRQVMSKVKKGEKGRKGTNFTRRMMEVYSIWIGRNESSLYGHMDYLDKLTAGEMEASVKDDKPFYGIFRRGAEKVVLEEEDSIEIEEESLRTSFDDVEPLNPEGYFITEEEKAKLLAFVGYGDYQKSSIIFFGNEEGLGGYELAYEMQAKAEAFGQHSETYLNLNDWRDGFYEIPENIQESYKGVLIRLRGSLKAQKALTSPMLEFQARIVKHFLKPEQNWFLKRDDAFAEFQEIKEYYQNDLYRRDSEFNLCLMDLRPFPRKNEKDKWPYQNLDQAQYLKAFEFLSGAKLTAEYQKLRDDRMAILKRMIEQSVAGYIVGIGAKDAKRRFFEQNFNGVRFEEYSLTKDKVEMYKAVLPLERGPVTVLLCDFFDHYNIGVAGLEKLAKEHIHL